MLRRTSVVTLSSSTAWQAVFPRRGLRLVDNALAANAGSLGSVTEAKQSKRILWIFPNYRAVSADTQLPPLSLKN